MANLEDMIVPRFRFGKFFCCSLRAASIVTGFLFIVLSLLFAGLAYFCTFLRQEERLTSVLRFPFILWSGLFALCSLIMLLSSTVMLIGVIKGKVSYIYPWIVLNSDIAVGLLFALYWTLSILMMFVDYQIGYPVLVLSFLFMAFHYTSSMVVNNYFMELKDAVEDRALDFHGDL